ncbi:hypothetical protein [Streptomyces sp. NPDC029554]|uniref:hypothetical protein n=1 Tax=Streptomyces sp. NPDC029554 TaxID=3155126 RepID=UPI0033DE5389
MGVTTVLAGSAVGIGLAEQIAAQLGLVGADPATSLLRRDRGAQAAALRQAGIPALRSVRTASVAEALTWAEEAALPAYELAPAAVGVPIEPVVCESALRINSAWPALQREAARHSGDAHLVAAEHLPGRRYLAHSVTRRIDGQADHVVTDVWAETRTSSGRLARTDLVSRHQLLTRAIHMHVLRALDVLGVVSGPATFRIAYADGLGPVLLSALALPVTSLADQALREATGHDRLTGALDAVIPPAPAQLIPVPTGHRVVRAHLHPRHRGLIDPQTARILRGLPTVAAVSDDLRESTPSAPLADTEVVLAGDPDAVEADYRAIRALERDCLYPAAADAPHPCERPT